MQRHPQSVLAVIFILLFHTGIFAQASDHALLIRFDQGKRVIMEGTINDTIRVNMLLDTGSNCSVISTRLADRLQCRTLLNDVPILWSDQRIGRPMVVVPSIQMGPFRRALACLKAEIPLPEVDVIIGRDVFLNQAFTINYQQHELEFGSEAPLRYQVAFDPSRKEIVVPLQVGTHKIALLLDSGADHLYLFEHMVFPWLRMDLDHIGSRLRHLTIERRVVKTVLSHVRLGNAELNELDAVILESLPGGQSRVMEWHGLLGLSALKAKRVRFDLKNGRFSWER